MNNPEKKPYCQPEIARISLAPEETVLGACKDSGGAEFGLGDFHPCLANGCNLDGS